MAAQSDARSSALAPTGSSSAAATSAAVRLVMWQPLSSLLLAVASLLDMGSSTKMDFPESARVTIGAVADHLLDPEPGHDPAAVRTTSDALRIMTADLDR